MQSRYYNPEWSRFINADDSEILTTGQKEIFSTNLFAYCANNPVMNSDPTGKRWWWGIANWVLGRIIDVAILLATGISTYMAGRALVKAVMRAGRTLSRVLRYQIIKFAGWGAASFASFAVDMVLAAVGSSLGQMFAYAIDRWIDPLIGCKRSSGSCFDPR